MERTDARDPFSALFPPLMLDEAEPPSLHSIQHCMPQYIKLYLVLFNCMAIHTQNGKGKGLEDPKKKKNQAKGKLVQSERRNEKNEADPEI
jgi:hypothetical protein